MKSGSCKLIRYFIGRYYADIIACNNMFGISHTDSESFTLQDVFYSLMIFTKT